jgi:hypothetical protein
LLAKPANRHDGLKRWHQSSEQNAATQLPTINKAFGGNIASSASIKLDSIITLKNQLEYFTYDSLGHLISARTYVSYDPVLNLYNAGYEDLYTYANGFCVTQIHKGYEYIENVWINNYKNEFTNDVHGNQASYTSYDWNTIKSTWEVQSKSVNTYNPSGKITLETDSVWNKTTSKFDNSYKYEFQYDANGNQTLKTIYSWKTDSLKWSKYSRNENTYDANGNITLSKNYNYGYTGTNYLSTQSEYAYDAGNLITITSYYGSYGSATLTFSTKVEYSYDTNGNRTQEIDYNWNPSKQVWDNSSKISYSYDLSVNAANVLWPFSGDNWVKNKITSFQSIRWMIKQAGEQPQWYPQPVHQYYYSDYSGIIPLAIEQKSTNDINLNLYPNPFSSNTTIKYKISEPGFISLKVFDAMGTEVASLVNEQKLVGEYSVDWNAVGLRSGIYFCRLQAGTFTNTKKLVLQK